MADARASQLLGNIFVAALCGLAWELLTSTVASYLLGDTVGAFALVLGVFLASMGVGAGLAGRVDRRAAEAFVAAELGLAAVGATTVPLLFAAAGGGHSVRVPLVVAVAFAGGCVGAELPLLVRLLGRDGSLSTTVSRAFFADHVGSLAAALLVPLVLLPRVGLVRAALLVGATNALLGLWATWTLRAEGLARWSVPVALGELAAIGFAWRHEPAILRLAGD